ncbi:MAG: metallophosphoesterase [Rhodothermales bacterium]
MMIALISDIHGNFPALRSVLAEIDALGAEEIICLGDVAGYYAQVDECVAELKSRNIASLMGNHDFYLSTGRACDRSNSANQCLDYQRSQLQPDTLAWLKVLPKVLVRSGMNMVHAGWRDPLEEYMSPSNDYFSSFLETCFASGHSHVQYVWQGETKTYCNPGSVGQPRDGDPRAAFALWDGCNFTLHRIAYDIDATAHEMRRAGFSPYFFDNLYKGSRIGGRIDSPPW